MLLRALLLVLVLAVPLAHAQPSNAADFQVILDADAAPVYEGPVGLLDLEESVPGERYAWNITLSRDYTTGEFLLRGFDVERGRQMVPLLHIHESEPVCQVNRTRGSCDYPLFEMFPHERVWEVDGPARVFHLSSDEAGYLLRIGIPGPVNATLVLERDVTPPGFTLGPISQLTPIGFYQETTTNELALADLQVREVGTEEWIRNPTPAYHVLQKFPVQGLDADTVHEVRVVFTDWAGNAATSDIYQVRTPPQPVGPKPVVTPISPEPNASVPATDVEVRARIESPDSPVAPDGVRLFFDLKEIHEGYLVENGTLVYRPPSLEPGRHVVSVEVTNVDGGRATTRWTFEVGSGPRAATPGPELLLVAFACFAAAALRRR